MPYDQYELPSTARSDKNRAAQKTCEFAPEALGTLGAALPDKITPGKVLQRVWYVLCYVYGKFDGCAVIKSVPTPPRRHNLV